MTTPFNPATLDSLGVAMNAVAGALYGALCCATLAKMLHKRVSELRESDHEGSSEGASGSHDGTGSGDDLEGEGDAAVEGHGVHMSPDDVAAPQEAHRFSMVRRIVCCCCFKSQRPQSVRKRDQNRNTWLVIWTLLFYCLFRCVQLGLFAGRVLDSSGDLNTHLYTSIPAVAFSLLQSAMLMKWIGHLDDLTQALRKPSFRHGLFLIHCSRFMALAEVVIAILAIVDIAAGVHFSSQPSTFWNELSNAFCGVVYFANGLCFTGIGIFIRSLWVSHNSVEVRSSISRILIIALAFGIMCAMRGAILFLFLSGGDVQPAAGASRPLRATSAPHTPSPPDNLARTMTHNEWGAPTVLYVEWVVLVLCIFVVPRSSSRIPRPSTLSATGNGIDESGSINQNGPPPQTAAPLLQHQHNSGTPSPLTLNQNHLKRVSLLQSVNPDGRMTPPPLLASERSQGGSQRAVSSPPPPPSGANSKRADSPPSLGSPLHGAAPNSPALQPQRSPIHSARARPSVVNQQQLHQLSAMHQQEASLTIHDGSPTKASPASLSFFSVVSSAQPYVPIQAQPPRNGSGGRVYPFSNTSRRQSSAVAQQQQPQVTNTSLTFSVNGGMTTQSSILFGSERSSGPYFNLE